MTVHHAQRWGAFGEVGTSIEMHPDERPFLRAVSQAHLRTGLPIFTHTEHDGCASCALTQLDLFEAQGVDPRHLCIGHLSDITQEDDPDSRTHQEIARRGAFLGFDTVGRALAFAPPATGRMGKLPPSFPDIPEAEKVRRVVSIVDAGYEDQCTTVFRFLERGRPQVQLGERVLNDPCAVHAQATTRGARRGDAPEDPDRQSSPIPFVCADVILGLT